MTKMDFMIQVKEILESVPDNEIVDRGELLKKIIDDMVKQELMYAQAGIRE